MQLQGSRVVFKKQWTTSSYLCLRRCQARGVFRWPVVLLLSLSGIIIATSMSAFRNSHTDIVTVYLNWSDTSVSEGEYGLIFQVLVIFVFGASSFASVWLAGWKYKLQSIIIVGILFICLGILINILISLVISATESSEQSTWVTVLDYLSPTIVVLGSGFVVTNMLQLTIEQIPEASTAQLSALVSWFLFCNYLSTWLNSSINDIFVHCIAISKATQFNYLLVLKLAYAASIAIFISLYFLFKHKLLDNSPTSNTTRHIYEVLKYAYKHKYPERRSALTYWEDVPVSRLCSGKRKYGGPFTNEQVEDVRTFISMSVLLLTFFIYLGLISIHGNSLHIFEINSGSNHSLNLVDYSVNNLCIKGIILSFTGTFTWWMSLFIIVYELFLVPVFSYRMPNIIHRLSFVSFAYIFFVFFVTVIVAIKSYSRATGNIYILGLHIGVSAMVGVFGSLCFISLFEFICAQSPYTMRNYFIGVAMWGNWSCTLLAETVFRIWRLLCSTKVVYLVIQ